MRLVFLFSVLVGCAPILRSATPEYVQIEYGDTLTVEDTEEIAQRNCAQYGRKAVFLNSALENPDGIFAGSHSPKIATYECVAPD